MAASRAPASVCALGSGGARPSRPSRGGAPRRAVAGRRSTGSPGYKSPGFQRPPRVPLLPPAPRRTAAEVKKSRRRENLFVRTLRPKRGGAFDKISQSATDAFDALLGTDISGAPVARGDVSALLAEPLFIALYEWFLELGGVFRLPFGPKNFLVVSDPVIAKYILQDQSGIYSKGILGEILKPIMGEGLIPAKPEVAAKRRRVVVPAVHNAYLKRMMRTFSETAWELADEVEGKIGGGGGSAGQQGWPPHSASDLLQSHAADSEHHGRYLLDMEQQFNHVTLDIVGRAVFNWDFGTVTSVEETDLVKAVYGVMSEADHRATFFLPYWNVPVLGGMVPRQRRFRKALGLLNGQLDELIGAARAACEAEGGREDLELLQARDYENVKDPSMLRFLVDMRGEEAGDKQLRDDLMTLLIAGHETTSSVLTWLLFELSQRPALMAEVVAEVDAVMAPLERGLAEGERPVLGLDDVKALKLLRVAFAETLRLYPQPPLLIRRALKEDNNVPKGCAMAKGSDIFISSYNIHRSKALYGEDVLDFNPKRWLSDFGQGQVEGWAGYSAEAMGLYPNEKSTDFAFLPFGAGNRKCIGDVFAVAEGVTIMAVILRRFRFELAIAPEEVGMVTAATIHTESGLVMSAERRTDV